MGIPASKDRHAEGTTRLIAISRTGTERKRTHMLPYNLCFTNFTSYSEWVGNIYWVYLWGFASCVCISLCTSDSIPYLHSVFETDFNGSLLQLVAIGQPVCGWRWCDKTTRRLQLQPAILLNLSALSSSSSSSRGLHLSCWICAVVVWSCG